MAAEALKSTQITNLDASPVVANTAGVTAPAEMQVLDGSVAVTATGIAAVGSTYQLARVPSNAIIKSVVIATSTALDTNASNTLAFDFNFAFSDSTVDGTQAALQGLVPTSANTGSTTTFATYSSPNKIYGTYTPASHTAALAPTDIVANGIGTNYPLAKITTTELWSLFGWTTDPGGFFDLVAYTSTGAATGAAGTLYAKLTFVLPG